LAATTYAALACAALVTSHPLITAVLWTCALLAVVMGMKACFDAGDSQGAAFGYLLCAATYFALACIVPAIVPPFQYHEHTLAWRGLTATSPDAWPALGPINAIGVMASGVLGGALGALAFRRSHRD
jgi:hypothetical protein